LKIVFHLLEGLTSNTAIDEPGFADIVYCVEKADGQFGLFIARRDILPEDQGMQGIGDGGDCHGSEAGVEQGMNTRGHEQPEPDSIEVVSKILFCIKNILDGPGSRRVRIFFAGGQHNSDAKAEKAAGQGQRVFFHDSDLIRANGYSLLRVALTDI